MAEGLGRTDVGLIVLGLVIAGLVGIAALVLLGDENKSEAPPAQAVEVGVINDDFGEFPRNHTDGEVLYNQVPPVGGDHDPVWQNCGVYKEPIRTENAVHSMEHGAVWITHDPALPEGEQKRLEDLASTRPYLLVSPWHGGELPAPIVVSAWGAQLPLKDLDSPVLDQFLSSYLEGPSAPEQGGSCDGGESSPASRATG